ncbi:hypothetical protein RHSIM_RhsimUnG0083300 [Rhododendron simsii]|uniref:Uncharacterized protein n=1 Tax=Rhododendron simsii TaxID=118357 RepID=A0A834FW48_RHOSS|nr:hypothetical protein RHSIM_RhsimUnG0083300 [Rhododendron simsii]
MDPLIAYLEHVALPTDRSPKHPSRTPGGVLVATPAAGLSRSHPFSGLLVEKDGALSHRVFQAMRIVPETFSAPSPVDLAFATYFQSLALCPMGGRHYRQGNSQAEAANKAISIGLKHRLTNKCSKWAAELLDVLRGYHTTPRRGTGWTPYSMAFSIEVVLPMAVTRPTARIATFNVPTNDAMLAAEADYIDELQDDAHIKYAAY